MKARMISVCCEAEPSDEIQDGAGRCSRCKEGAMFEADSWTEDEIASIKADMDYAKWKEAGKPGRIGTWRYARHF